MTQTHISYKVSKKLKEFMGKDAPEPMEDGWWFWLGAIGETPRIVTNKSAGKVGYPTAYQLHDLLSKPFCEAMAVKIEPLATKGVDSFVRVHIAAKIFGEYYNNGLLAVEAALERMMEAK